MSYSSEVLADSPAVYWRLGETSGTTAVDSSGNGRHGTYSGTYTLNQASLTADPTGKSVATVRGVNGGVINSSYGASVSAFTLEGWVKTGDSSGAFIIGRDDANVNANRLFWLWVNGTTPQLRIQYPVGSGSYVDVSGAVLTVGTIHYLAATYDGTTIRLYVDGVQSGTPSTAVSGSLNTSATVSSGGVSIYGTTTGNIQDVAYYTTALSSTRIAAHYAAATASTDVRIGALSVEVADQDGGDLLLGGFRVEVANQGVGPLLLGGLSVEVASVDGTAPTGATMKVWNGSAWVDAPVKVWNGTAWVDATAVKTWNGSAWV